MSIFSTAWCSQVLYYRVLVLVKWTQLQLRFWTLILHSFIFTPNHKSNEMDWGKHIYGDSRNVMCSVERDIRVHTNINENKKKGGSVCATKNVMCCNVVLTNYQKPKVTHHEHENTLFCFRKYPQIQHYKKWLADPCWSLIYPQLVQRYIPHKDTTL